MIEFLRKLWPFVRPYRARLFLGIICGALFGVSNGLMVGSIRVVFDLVFDRRISLHDKLENAPHWAHGFTHWLAKIIPDIQAPADSNTLGWVLLVSTIPVIVLFRNTMNYCNIYFTNWAATHAITDIRIKLFAHMQTLSLGFFNRTSTGDNIGRITSDTQMLYMIVGNSLAAFITAPLTIIVLIAYSFAVQPTLTLVATISFPICIVPIIIYGRKVRKSSRSVQDHNASLTNLMHEAFTGTRVIKAYNLEATVTEQFRATIKKTVSQMMRVLRANELPSQFTELFSAAGIALVFLYIIHLPPAERPSSGDCMAFIIAIVVVYPQVKIITRIHNQMLQARAASERVFELLAMQNSVPEPAEPKMLHADKADIVIENLDFHYGNKDKVVLHNINLTIKAGQLVALVGESGSGKTTIANLMLRFYDPVKGSIKIGGVDLREVTSRDLRNQIAFVAQENILFNDTIRRNIELGRLGANDDDIHAAAKSANAMGFINDKKEQFDYKIGEKGVMLSGGQKQRIAIARAVLRNAPILILDEATSALDTESERMVQNALDELMKGKTCICIAHRLSTILHADLIVVLKDGRIVEQGRFDELLKLGGVFHKLYTLQFSAKNQGEAA